MTKEELELAQTREKAKLTLGRGMVDVKDIIAPPALQVDFDHIRIGETFTELCLFRATLVLSVPTGLPQLSILTTLLILPFITTRLRQKEFWTTYAEK